MKMSLTYLILLVAIFSVSGCIVVKENDDEPNITPLIKLSPVPEIIMSDNLVRSSRGDMVAFIPKNWFFVDVEEKASSEIIAVAVNPEYTLNAVFSVIRKNEKIDSLVANEGLYGLARYSFSRRERKTAGAVKLVGKYEQIEMGYHEFVKYNFTTTGGAIVSQTLVFQSQLEQYYEFTLLPMDVKGSPIASQKDIDKIFRSIASTIKFN